MIFYQATQQRPKRLCSQSIEFATCFSGTTNEHNISGNVQIGYHCTLHHLQGNIWLSWACQLNIHFKPLEGTESHDMNSFHLTEIQSNKNLVPDIDYYLKSQILPIVKRICVPFKNIKDYELLSSLGFEVKEPKPTKEKNQSVKVLQEMQESHQNKNMFSVMVMCRECGQQSNFLPDKHIMVIFRLCLGGTLHFFYLVNFLFWIIICFTDLN